MPNLELTIGNGSDLYQPVVEGNITWETERVGVPGKLTFKVVNDGKISFQEGDCVQLKVDGTGIFRGYVFSKKRNKDQVITVTAYDQLRYLKNKDSYHYTLTASDLVRKIAKDFNLQIGQVEDTGYVIENRTEENTTLFDMIQTALGFTLENKSKIYVLFDDFGKLSLRDIESMKLNIFIDEETGEDFDYTSTIDGAYNKIKLEFDNPDTGETETCEPREDSEHIKQWGVLQYYEKLQETTNAKAKADALLKLHNQKQRNLSVKNCFGDTRVRAGCSLVVFFTHLGDISVQNYMIVDKVKHTLNKNEHLMDLTLIGGVLNA